MFSFGFNNFLNSFLAHFLQPYEFLSGDHFTITTLPDQDFFTLPDRNLSFCKSEVVTFRITRISFILGKKSNQNGFILQYL